MRNGLKLIISVIGAEFAGIVGSLFTAPAIPTWYASLTKPAFNPPSWIFAPVWTTLYAFMGIAAFLVWQKGLDRADVRKALGVFLLQLVLNAAWSIIFFGLHNPAWALFDITALWLAIIWNITLFYAVSKPAAWLLVPYILWVSFAAYLNWSLWMLN